MKLLFDQNLSPRLAEQLGERAHHADIDVFSKDGSAGVLAIFG